MASGGGGWGSRDGLLCCLRPLRCADGLDATEGENGNFGMMRWFGHLFFNIRVKMPRGEAGIRTVRLEPLRRKLRLIASDFPGNFSFSPQMTFRSPLFLSRLIFHHRLEQMCPLFGLEHNHAGNFRHRKPSILHFFAFLETGRSFGVSCFTCQFPA